MSSAKDVLTDATAQNLRVRALRAQSGLEDHPGRWVMQDGCSFRRIGTSFGDGVVLRGTVHHRDNWPDLQAKSGVLDYIATADPAMILALLDERDAMLAEIQALRDAKPADDNKDLS